MKTFIHEVVREFINNLGGDFTRCFHCCRHIAIWLCFVRKPEESTCPNLPRASVLRVLAPARFSIITDHVFNYQPSASKLLTSPRMCSISSRHPWSSRSFTLPKMHQFLNLFPWQQQQRKCSQGFKKTRNIQPGIHRKRFL